MATAHVLCGYVASGKTTFAKELARRLPAVRFSPDDWAVAVYGSDPARIDREMVGRIDRLVASIWQEVLGAGIDVVLDVAVPTRASRAHLREVVERLGADTALYWVQCPAEIARKRCSIRSSQPGGLRIDGQAFDRINARFELPAPDEPYVPVDGLRLQT